MTETHHCNAPTKAGPPCRVRVERVGERCRQHGGAVGQLADLRAAMERRRKLNDRATVALVVWGAAGWILFIFSVTAVP